MPSDQTQAWAKLLRAVLTSELGLVFWGALKPEVGTLHSLCHSSVWGLHPEKGSCPVGRGAVPGQGAFP